MSWPSVVLATYLVVLGTLSVQGLHRVWLIGWALRGPRECEPPPPDPWPVVTVQLPLFNERYVVERVIRAVVALEYPRNLLEIQVLDDSTDETTALARAEVERYRAEGVQIRLIHRLDRVGFKAGALQGGLDEARGDVIAIFDADFVPRPDFLRRTLPWLGEGVGMVQARWGHLNARDSWLTLAQSTLLDGHFVVEHTARWRSGRWFNFNGTAGIWRRAAIVAAGGWQHDTLTEDLDLSYRCQMKGWTFRYLVDVVAPAELPSDMAAFKSQQHRWAKGSVQTARKLLGSIWATQVPLGVKVEATAHLTANGSYPLVVVLSLLLPWAVAARLEGAPTSLLALDFVLFMGALLPFVAFYGLAVVRSGSVDVTRRLFGLPIVLAVGLGLAVSQTGAVMEGLFAPIGSFARTPKRGGGAGAAYRAAGRGLVGLELVLAAYLLVACGYVVRSGYLAALPFLLLFTSGYAAVGLAALRR